MKPLGDFERECLMPINEWLGGVKCGCFIDYDGDGNFATETEYDAENHVCPSMIKQDFVIPSWVTHIVWYNR